MEAYRSSVREIIHQRIGDLAIPPHLLRRASEAQYEAREALLAQVGKVAVIRAYDREGALTLIDDVAVIWRTIAPDETWPVAVLDVNDADAALIRVTDLAWEQPQWWETDAAALDTLLREVSTDAPAVAAMLASLAGEGGEPVNPEDLWKGMPEFEQEDLKDKYKSLIVHFATEEDYQDFARLVNQTLTPQSNFIWHPYRPTHGVAGSMQGYTVEDES